MSTIAARSLPLSARLALSSGGGGKELVAKDRARAQKFLQGLSPHGPTAHAHHARRHRHHHGHAHRGEVLDAEAAAAAAQPTSGAGTASGAGSADSIDVTDASVNYDASVGVGSPATTYTLLIDTGSSNTWVGAAQAYAPTSTSKSTGNAVNVSYGSGAFSGTEYVDRLTLAPALVIPNQSLGVASSAQGFSGVDGILGVGPTDLTQGTVANTSTVPTVTDNLFAQGVIPEEVLGISFEPTTTEGAMNGELTFGGVDASKHTGALTYVPITSTAPASGYWGIDQSLAYGTGGTQLLNAAAGIVDTGTTLLMVSADAFDAYQAATGATMDDATGLLTLSESQYARLQSLYFTVGGATLELTPNAQIWPRALNATLGGSADGIYLVVASTGSPSGSGLDFINGFAFLQRFYSVFDTSNTRVGLAPTPYTDATTN